jgi:starvation-inducible DNA-binding protein
MKQSVDIRISEQSRIVIADGLSRLLADAYTLYLKTHNFHRNVTGPMFNMMQYTELDTGSISWDGGCPVVSTPKLEEGFDL